MEITFSGHAIHRLGERNLEKDDIIMVVNNYDYKETLTRKRTLVRKSVRNQTYEVIYVEERGKIIIITAYLVY
jgi:hypothetical protein